LFDFQRDKEIFLSYRLHILFSKPELIVLLERRERKRERAGANGPASSSPPPQPLGSTYMGGGDDCLHFILMVRLDIISRFSNLYNKVFIKSLLYKNEGS
jgi:hypothetical protein